MSYKSRERKRKASRAPKIAAAAARARRNADTELRYFLCRVRHETRCMARGCKLRRGASMVYRRNGQVKLCVPCADRDPLVSYRPSAAWEALRRAELKKR